MSQPIELTFHRHRAQVTSSDASPLITNAYADLSDALIAKFKRIYGANPVLILKWGGTGAKTGKIRPFFIDETVDLITNSVTVPNNSKENVLNWDDEINVDTLITRIPLHRVFGSKLFVAVTNLAANSTLDIFIANASTND